MTNEKNSHVMREDIWALLSKYGTNTSGAKGNFGTPPSYDFERTSRRKSAPEIKTSGYGITTKECDDAEFQYHWLRRQEQLFDLRLSDKSISYSWVQGNTCRQWPMVYEAAWDNLWYRDNYVPVMEYNPMDYLVYVRRIEEYGQMVKPVARIIENWDYEEVNAIHGDLTLSNTIWDGKQIVFIDPGNPRSLPVRELDESKILQSLDGWSEMTGQVIDHTIPFPSDKIHWALLTTHYIRLLNHDWPESHKKFAFDRIQRIRKWIA